MIRKLFFIVSALALVAAVVLATGPARADDADYFKGKTISYIIATTAGGGYDFYARMVTRHMKRVMPGVTFAVVNRPGAGHVVGANLIYAAKPNGLTMGTFNTGLIYAQLIGQKGIRFDLRNMSWIGKAAADPRVVVTGAKLPFKSILDFRKQGTPFKFGASGIGSSAYNEMIMLSRALDLNVRLIPGYGGTHSQLAIMRGELVGMMGGESSVHSFLGSGKGRALLQIGGTPMVGAPLAKDLVNTPDGKSLVALIGSQAELARFTAGPPKVPAGRLAVLRAAYKQALTSKELGIEALKAHRPINPGFGEDVAKVVREAFQQSPTAIKLLKDVLGRKPGATQVPGTQLVTITPDGRWISFKNKAGKAIKSKISGSRTQIMVAGKKAKRKALKVGMTCDIAYAPGSNNEPKTITCK
ncbi:MAG: tripartite-type tricarboxylate transporter receptor subunit TctC [Alphaproteobacteria bacterium]|jgi:tripartite-type tricarboxylate transporter receptor subunit TctC